MLSPEGLLETHRRVHFGLCNLLDHCRQLTDEELHRALPGIGMPTVQEQLIHMISCEAYWVLVLRAGYANGDLRPEEEARWQERLYPDIESLEALRAAVVASTESYLRETSAEVLATPSEFYTFDLQPHKLVPQWVIMRIVTHHFHHRGLVAAMCRMLGKPYPDDAPSLDFPLRSELPTS